MSWITTIPYKEAKGTLLKLYNRIKGPNDHIDHILTIHSLRPHSLQGHMTLYKNVLHHKGNSLEKWYLEALGIFVSKLNECEYCYTHHSVGLRKLLEGNDRVDKIIDALLGDDLMEVFTARELEGFKYANKITFDLNKVESSDIEALRYMGYTDGEILEINQVVSYFNYVNRTVVGLGVDLEKDHFGLSPNDNDDPNNWGHG